MPDPDLWLIKGRELLKETKVTDEQLLGIKGPPLALWELMLPDIEMDLKLLELYVGILQGPLRLQFIEFQFQWWWSLSVNFRNTCGNVARYLELHQVSNESTETMFRRSVAVYGHMQALASGVQTLP
eukprot:9724735-Karenia_brevis.AAC.1